MSSVVSGTSCSVCIGVQLNHLRIRTLYLTKFWPTLPPPPLSHAQAYCCWRYLIPFRVLKFIHKKNLMGPHSKKYKSKSQYWFLVRSVGISFIMFDFWSLNHSRHCLNFFIFFLYKCFYISRYINVNII